MAKKETDPIQEKIDEINAQLERVEELSTEELAQLEATLTDEFNAEDGSNVPRMQELADGIEKVVEQRKALATAEAERLAQVEELRNRVHAATTPEPETVAEEMSDEDAETTAEPTTTTEVKTETTTEVKEPQPEPVNASAEPTRPSIRQISERRPAAQAPRPIVDDRAPVTITASGDVPGFSAGSEIKTAREVGDAFARKIDALMGSKSGARYPVATIHAEGYPEDRVLVAGGVEQNTARVTKAIDSLETRMTDHALVAAGGLCAPVEARYDLTVIATADRPVRDALERFNAARGGVRYITPPTLAGVASGVAVWTAANDANPTAPATKPCVTITCGAEQTAIIDAITLCIKVGNFSRMTFPEQFAAWYQLGLAAHARVAEQHLLDGIYAASVHVTQAAELGAVRDVIGTYVRAAAEYRNRQRMAADATLTALLPAWLPDAMAGDLLKQMPGDDEIGTARSEIVGWFRQYNIEPSFYLDERTSGGQIYAAQGAGALLGYKGTVDGYLFHPGAFMFLDGGTLDLGVDIRDSALNSTNDVKAFMETFENVAFNGIQSLNIVNTICVNGASAGTQTPTVCA